jgi:hypothetical protein
MAGEKPSDRRESVVSCGSVRAKRLLRILSRKLLRRAFVTTFRALVPGAPSLPGKASRRVIAALREPVLATARERAALARVASITARAFRRKSPDRG